MCAHLALFQSSFYNGFVDQTERILGKIDGDSKISKVNYRDAAASELGKYFLKLEKINLDK